MRVYVACLASYNAGILHGQWITIDAMSTVQDLEDDIDAMLAASPTSGAEEWAIHDYEGFGAYAVFEHEALSNLCALAEAYEAYGADVFHAALSLDASDANAAVWLMERHAGVFGSRAEWAADWLDQTASLDAVPEYLRGYIDYQAFARDAEIEGSTQFAEMGYNAVHVFST